MAGFIVLVLKSKPKWVCFSSALARVAFEFSRVINRFYLSGMVCRFKAAIFKSADVRMRRGGTDACRAGCIPGREQKSEYARDGSSVSTLERSWFRSVCLNGTDTERALPSLPPALCDIHRDLVIRDAVYKTTKASVRTGCRVPFCRNVIKRRFCMLSVEFRFSRRKHPWPWARIQCLTKHNKFSDPRKNT